jgi:geranylgeranyl pyrophosphate synthase
VSTAFAAKLAAWQARIERELDARLPRADVIPQRLHEAARYSVLGGGKRVRPVLVYATAEGLNIEPSQVDGAACAVELIHAYSLVHDDLPAMDDDDLRRGKPTCHKAFDEATAILVGDALQVLAFEILATDAALPASAEQRLQLVALLAKASGTAGMAGGQALDLAAVGRELALPDIEEMHARKTGALIRSSVMMAAACMSKEDAAITQALDRYATDLGLAFQIQDDLLDVEGDPALLGKPTGADSERGKPTYPAIAGLDLARRQLALLHRRAQDALAPLGERGRALIDVSDWLLKRQH